MIGQPIAPSSSRLSTPAVQPTAKPYGRGSINDALRELAFRPEQCVEHIQDRRKANTSKGPFESRKHTWQTLALQAGYRDGFILTPTMIFAIIGLMDKAEYRSPELYLDTAKQTHIEMGNEWTHQLALATRQAKRACQRRRGPPKQAQPLPRLQLAELRDSPGPIAAGGPSYPIRSVFLASWWLLREIEAGSAKLEHIKQDKEGRMIHWKLPSSKTDWKGLGATRTHTCNCEARRNVACPYHAMSEHLVHAQQIGSPLLFTSYDGTVTTKAGWADTMQAIGKLLKLPLLSEHGSRRFTGHTARATGAVYMAQTQTELWRIQLFGSGARRYSFNT